MPIFNLLHKRTLVVCVMVAAVLLAGNATIAQARLTACRADPIVFLSDGSKLVITLTIATDESNVTRVLYTVHAPRGTRVDNVVYTAGGIGQDELFQFFDDNPPDHYTTNTIVKTSTRGAVAVTAISSLDNSVSGSDSGFENQVLTVNLAR